MRKGRALPASPAALAAEANVIWNNLCFWKAVFLGWCPEPVSGNVAQA